jgi:hypothetical protein
VPLIVLYNVQRLFRPGGSAVARALDVTEDQGWDNEAYRRKVDAVGSVLASATGGTTPAILALVEVEDATVVADVCSAAGWPQLVDVDVPNEQVDGYDVAIAYDPTVFTGPSAARSFTFDNRFATRDLLMVSLGLLHGGSLLIGATHWASRTMAEAESLRIGAAVFCSNLLERAVKFGKEELIDPGGAPRMPSRDELAARWRTPILFAGDLNDGPWDRSVRTLLRATLDIDEVRRAPRLPTGRTMQSVAAYLRLRPRLFNPTWGVVNSRIAPPGTYRFGGEWNPLDQILVSAGMLEAGGPMLVPGSVRIHAPATVVASDGTVIRVRTGDGTPLTFNARTHAGVSDHLPLVAEVDLDAA